MKTHGIREYLAHYSPASVANGFIGLRIGKNPLTGTVLVNGFYGTHDAEMIESIAPAVYPVGADLQVGGLWVSERPDLTVFGEQRYDFANGELTTHFAFPAGQATAEVEVVTFANRTMPTMAMQEIRVRVNQACALTMRATMDPAGIPGRCVHRDTVNVDWRPADGSMWWESAGGVHTCGAAYTTDLLGGEEKAKPKKTMWGFKNALTSDYAIQAVPGKTYVLRQIGCLVPNIMHAQPEREAIRLIGIARQRGFEELRASHQAAWAELWKGRVKLIGAGEAWQDKMDACYFYMHSSAHASMQCSVPAWGLGRWQNYHGMVFWDCETFTFPPVLLTNPAAARAMMDYRTRCLPQAKSNAALNGYQGVQFPWSTTAHGGENLPSWALACFAEQHINLDVAFAFAQFANVTGDREFAEQQAWPVLKGVAQWIESRVEKTGRGFEIRHITGIDEEIDNVNNNSYTNAAATVILREAAALGLRLGKAVPEIWGEMEKGMFIPIDAQTGVIKKHDDFVYKGEPHLLNAEPLTAFFPLTYRTEKKIEKATFEYYLKYAHTYMGYPMIASLYGVYAARLGNREQALEMFERGIGDYAVEPYLQFVEYLSKAKEPQAVPIAPYIANMAGFVMACMYGLTGVELGTGEPETWCKHRICLPAGWEAIEIDRIFVRGCPARLEARHGQAKAQISMLR